MRAAVIALALAVVLGACSAQERQPQAIDYEAMNEAAEGPAIAIAPDPIAFADIEKYDLFGAGCTVPASDGGRLLLIADDTAAHFLLEGELIELAAKPGAPRLPYGAVSVYDGLAYSVDLVIDPATEDAQGGEVTSYDGSLIIHDAKDRAVFEYLGKVHCGA